MGTGQATNTEVVKIEQTQAASTGQRYTTDIRTKGDLQTIWVHFPAGCNALVEVATGIRTERGVFRQLVPSWKGEFINLDNVTVPFQVDEPVEEGDVLWADIYNYDSTNPHNISVLGEIHRRKTMSVGVKPIST